MGDSLARVLITGARGTIGTPLWAELVGRGHRVLGCDLAHSDLSGYQRADMGQYRDVQRVIDWAQPDYVIHLAAEFGRVNGEENYETLWRTNVIGTRHLLEEQAQHGFKVVFASSSEVYAEIDGEGPYDSLGEHLTEGPQTPQHKNDYAISKWVSELQIRHMAERHGTETMTLRFFNSYGPGEYYHPYRSVVCLFCYRALHNLPYTVYKGYSRAFMFMDDFIPTLANTVDSFRAGETVNIGGLETRTVEELDQIIHANVPGQDRSLVNFQAKEDMNVRDKVPDNSRAIAQLGHGPDFVPLEDGVRQTIEWMRHVYG